MPSESLKEALLRAADLIERPEHWIQGDAAQTVGGHSIQPKDPEAAKWCMLGAVDREASYEDFDNFLNLWFDVHGIDVGVSDYNDAKGRTSHQAATMLRSIAYGKD